jgi:hypothetical protein
VNPVRLKFKGWGTVILAVSRQLEKARGKFLFGVADFKYELSSFAIFKT